MDLYDHPDLYEALLPAGPEVVGFYSDLARGQGGPVLELACGSGLVAVPIAETGCETFGLDRSPAMLATARARAEARGTILDLAEGDMRDFDLGRLFSLIFVARNSLLHLESAADFRRVLACVRRHLAPGGMFAFDVFNPDVRILARPGGQRVPLMRIESGPFGELAVESTVDYDAATQVGLSPGYVSAPGRPDAWTFSIHVRSVFPQELPLLIESGGLRLESRFGDFDGSAFKSASPRQVCVCRPAGRRTR